MRNLRAVLTAIALSLPAGAGAWEMLTPGEIALRREEEPTREIRALRADGPEIRIHAPGGFELASPVDFDVELLPRAGISPDMASLKVEYRIGPIWTDITARLRANARVEGLRLRAPGATLPEGRHELRLTVSDRAGGITVARISFRVRA